MDKDHLADRDSQLAFISGILYSLVTNQTITEDEIQALENIMQELPEVKTADFRY